MFGNISGKIKKLAEVVTGIGIIIAFVLVIVFLSMESLGGILVAVLLAFVSWIGSFALYGFGQLIENTDKLVKLQNCAGEALQPKTETFDSEVIKDVVLDIPNEGWIKEQLDELKKKRIEGAITIEEYNDIIAELNENLSND